MGNLVCGFWRGKRRLYIVAYNGKVEIKPEQFQNFALWFQNFVFLAVSEQRFLLQYFAFLFQNRVSVS